MTRVIVVPIITREERLLLARMAPDRGVFAGQWALPGGGVEPDEAIEDALRREVQEELGVVVTSATPLRFSEARLDKRMPDGTTVPLHMIFLLYHCQVAGTIHLNEEFTEYAWFTRAELAALTLNDLTTQTLTTAGFLDVQ